MTAADTFRKVDGLAAEGRRALVKGGDRATTGGYLVAVQSAAQNGLREALADQPKLAAFDGLLGALSDLLALCYGELRATTDPGEYEEVTAAEAAIANAKEQTAPDADATRAVR